MKAPQIAANVTGNGTHNAQGEEGAADFIGGKYFQHDELGHLGIALIQKQLWGILD